MFTKKQFCVEKNAQCPYVLLRFGFKLLFITTLVIIATTNQTTKKNQAKKLIK